MPEEPKVKVELVEDVILVRSDVKLEEDTLPEEPEVEPEVKAELREEPLPEAKVARTALKRRATEEPEDEADVKRPRVSLPRIEALDIPLEAFRAYNERRTRGVVQGLEGRTMEGIDEPEAYMLPPIVQSAKPRVVGCV